jgi:hypothetical protein
VTRLNFTLEQNKIPEFYGKKVKDTISAVDFIRIIDDLAKLTTGWTWQSTTTSQMH